VTVAFDLFFGILMTGLSIFADGPWQVRAMALCAGGLFFLQAAHDAEENGP
jgi:hypothetical protein